MMIFCRFENGRHSGDEVVGESEAFAYVTALQTASRCLGVRVWVAESLPLEGGVDNDSWLCPEDWLDRA
jgi:hypothetical protein